ncbi:MAG: phosphoglycerate mutase [Acidimicrobiales bacterium]|nr:MAG: phosphoglycerate mutase [Acidimicrobiales bacterium]
MAASAGRVLHLLRHAKAARASESGEDRDRPLDERGRREAERLAAHLADRDISLVVCSSALRARQTVEPLVARLGCTVSFEDSLYSADEEVLISRIRELSDEAREVLVCGHNPTIERAAWELSGEALEFPTCALATLLFPVDGWAEVERGGGRVLSFVVGRDLPD